MSRIHNTACKELILLKTCIFCRQLRDNETVTVSEAEVSLLVLALRDINGAEENPDLEFMEHDLRGYLKCLVQVPVETLIR